MAKTLAQMMDAQEFQRRAGFLRELLRTCTVCPRKCGVRRLSDERGVCGAGRDLQISSYGPHFGEESILSGCRGSGTIFLTGCNLGCVFCQNYDISQLRRGLAVSAERFADNMLELQTQGCHNINFVTPTHFTPQIAEAILMAKGRGLRLPLVYNCGGYESVDTLKLLDGIIDIYMPDAKYADPDLAERLSGAADYPEVMRAALKEMHRQVGDLTTEDGIAVKGILVRHLVLPNGLAGTERVLRFIADELSPNTYVNVMAQYHPSYHASQHPEIDRRLTREEYEQAVGLARELGLRM